jgi:hypothetical protein
MKLSNAVVAFIRENGKVSKDGTTIAIPLALLETVERVRSRSSAEDRFAKFETVRTAQPVAADGSIAIPAPELAKAGLPSASVANAAYWSGLGDGSEMAHRAGFKSRYETVLDAERGVYVITVHLAPLTDADREAHAKRQAVKAAKVQSAKNAAEASDEGAPVAVE